MAKRSTSDDPAVPQFAGIGAPLSEHGSATYDRECRAAMSPAFESLLDAAEGVGWNRVRVAYELMYLASHSAVDQQEHIEEQAPRP